MPGATPIANLCNRSSQAERAKVGRAEENMVQNGCLAVHVYHMAASNQG